MSHTNNILYNIKVSISLIFFISCMCWLLSCKRGPTLVAKPTHPKKSIKADNTNIAIAKLKPVDSLADNVPLLEDSMKHFHTAYAEISDMLDGKRRMDFKRAVFLVENAYYLGSLDYSLFCKSILVLKGKCDSLSRTHLIDYDRADSVNVKKNAAIYLALTAQRLSFGDSSIYLSRSYGYDFDDPTGKEMLENTFVTRLLSRRMGNCRSMAYLYTILSHDLKTPAWLALAPMHIYVKCRNQKMGFYNTELTSASFPSDAQIANSGYISTEAIVNGLYMDTLSQLKSIAMCMYDLVKAADRKFGPKQLAFVESGLEKSLESFPKFISALIFKARIRKKVYAASPSTQNKHLMEVAYLRFLKLGYQKMPDQNYRAWLKDLELGKRERFHEIYKTKGK